MKYVVTFKKFRVYENTVLFLLFVFIVPLSRAYTPDFLKILHFVSLCPSKFRRVQVITMMWPMYKMFKLNL